MTEIYLRSFETMEKQSRAKGFLRHKPLRCNVVELAKYLFNLFVSYHDLAYLCAFTNTAGG